jgi:hypothetical protein
MRSLRISCCAAVCAVLFQFAVWDAKPASAQIYYGTAITPTPIYLLPSPNYVVYSPNFLAHRSAGYYGGNWGPYYYNPPALYPYIPGNAIYPNIIPYYPPIVPPQPWR